MEKVGELLAPLQARAFRADAYQEGCSASSQVEPQRKPTLFQLL